MSEETLGALGWLKRLRGNRSGPGSSGQGQMKMLRRLPGLLRFIPGKAQNLRAYFLALQYWLAGSESTANLIRMLIERYADGPRAHLRGKLHAAAPIHYPEVGLYHPRARLRVCERLEHLPRGGKTGVVGLLVMRSYVLAGNTGHYDGVIAALEAKGLRVIPAFAAGSTPGRRCSAISSRAAAPIVDAVVSLTGFSLVGGPAYNDARAAEEMLAALDVPYIAAHPVEFQTLQQWQADARGLTPVEATMMVAIPELDGAIWPMTFGGRSSAVAGDGRRDMSVHAERAAMLAARVAKLVALRRGARAERKIAVVLFNFPPNGGSAGTAAYLSVYASLHRALLSLKQAGYRRRRAGHSRELRRRITEEVPRATGRTPTWWRASRPTITYERERWLREIERQWGPAPGRHQTDGGGLFVFGERFGNVFVGVQPAFGYEGDPMRLLFENGFAPTHAFSAFYRWLREDFGAHAVLHFGTHGALEFMPGKQAGLSGECWPDRS